LKNWSYLAKSFPFQACYKKKILKKYPNFVLNKILKYLLILVYLYDIKVLMIAKANLTT